MRKQALFLLFINFFGANNFVYAPKNEAIIAENKNDNKSRNPFLVKNIFKKTFCSAKFYGAVIGVVVLGVLGKVLVSSATSHNSSEIKNASRSSYLKKRHENLESNQGNNQKIIEEVKSDLKELSDFFRRESEKKQREAERIRIEREMARIKEGNRKLFDDIGKRFEEQRASRDAFYEKLRKFIEHLNDTHSFPKSNSNECQFNNGDVNERARHLQTLGLSGNPSQEEIRNAFKAEIFKWHPDKNSGFTTSRAQKINEAYNFLKDEL